MTDLLTPIVVRVHTTAPGSRVRQKRRPPRWRDASVGHRVLTVVMEGEEDGARPLTIGMFRVLARRPDGPYDPADQVTLTEPLAGVVVGDALPPRDRTAVRRWARSRGLRVLSIQEFIHEVFFKECYVEGTLGAAWDWGALASSVATTWAPSVRSRRSFMFTFCPTHARRRTQSSHNPSAHPHCPGMRVRALAHPYVQAAEFTTPRRGDQWGVPSFPGRFLGLHEKAYVLSGEDHSLASACRMMGIAPPTTIAAASVEDRLAALASRLDTACGLAAALQRELLHHSAIVSDENEQDRRRHRTPHVSVSDVHTPSAMGKRYLAAMGIPTPPRLAVSEGLGLSMDDVHGAGMNALYPGHAVCRHRLDPVAGLLADFRSMYPAVTALSRVSAWWPADRVRVEDATTATRRCCAKAAWGRLLDPAAWPSLAMLCLVQPDGDWGPVRVPHIGAELGDTVLCAPVTVPPHLGPVWWTLPDCLVSALRTGRPPRILRAVRFRPEGQRHGLRTIRFGGEVPLDPRRDLFVEIVEIRHRFARGNRPHLAQAAKVTANALAWGVAGELHRTAQRRVWVHNGVQHFGTTATYEQPAPYYCPPLAALVTGYGRLLLALFDHLVREAGGECAMLTTDAGFITGPDPLAIYRMVRDRLEPLNPFRTVGVEPFLQIDSHHGDSPRLLDYVGVSVNRYYLLDRRGDHRSPCVVKPSGQVLGSVLDPITHQKTHLGEGIPRWWFEGWQWIDQTRRPGRPARGPLWLDEPAAFVHTVTTPQEATQFRRLPGGIGPFQQVLLYGSRFNRDRFLPIAALTDPRHIVDAGTGRRLRPFGENDDGGTVILQTYRSLLADHGRHSEPKSPHGDRRGRIDDEEYHVTATGIERAGKETVLPVGGEDLGALLGGAKQRYAQDDLGDARTALLVLGALPAEQRKELANRLGVTRRRLDDVLDGRSTPRPGLRGRLTALAQSVQQNRGALPIRDARDALQVLRKRRVPVEAIAKVARVSDRTVRRWYARRSHPRHRAALAITTLARADHGRTQA